MKSYKIQTIIGLFLIMGLSSCGVNKAWVFNQNQNQTQVHLTSNNFKVVGRVEGTSKVGYSLIFGGKNKKQLYQQAYADMIEKADLTAGSRALNNVLTEEHVGGFPPFYYRRTLTVSATVVEFID